MALLSAPTAHAQSLSELALLHRCYTQITSLRLKDSDPLAVQVKAGLKTATAACLEVLKTAQFTADGNQTIGDTSSRVAKGVLATFHRLHSSWFYSKDFTIVSWPGHSSDIKDLYDSTTPALYFTRALFKPGTQARDAVTTSENLRAVRSNMNPTNGAETGHPMSDFILSNASFAPVGELFGVQPSGNPTVSFPTNPVDNPFRPAGTVNMHQSLGGGFLGTPAYLLLNVASLSSYQDYKTDGSLNLHRRWGKAVFHDSLCRELPVVRDADIGQFVDPMSTASFRTANSCTRCHASHDRVSFVIRNFKILYVGAGDPSGLGTKSRGGNFADFHAATRPAEAAWPITADEDFYRRPTNGTFYFRSYNGNLINQTLANVGDLGKTISETDDYYICLAKRYYSYFTGVEVDTGDIADPTHSPQLNSQDIKHRAIVIKLGQNLHTHQSLQQLIGEIINLENYRKIDFGVGSGVNVQ